MRTILIPTDFTGVPLLLLKHAASTGKERFDVIFMYSTFLSNSITELLFSSPAKIVEKATNNRFREGCSIILNRYRHQIRDIRYEVLFGNSVNAFRTLADANRIDEAFLPTEYSYALKGATFDPTSLIISSGVPVCKVDLQLTERVYESDPVTSLLIG